MREFPDPERFDIHRARTRHLAFGHGVHYCLGASLAKLEALVAWDELLRRIPEYEFADEPRHFVSSTFYGWEALHIDSDARSPSRHTEGRGWPRSNNGVILWARSGSSTPCEWQRARQQPSASGRGR